MMNLAVIFLALCAICVVAPANGRSIEKTNGKKLQGCYGVQFKKTASKSNKDNAKNKAGGQSGREWSSGFQVCNTNEKKMQRILEDEEVESVFEDGVVYKVGQTNVWGLDRIDSDGTSSRDNEYTSPGNQGQGVTVYVLDTCSDVSHPDFGGRASYVTAADQYPTDDFTASCCDHGTHCMGTVGGTNYGVAKQATLKSIRVLSCAGSGSYTGIISGIDWVRNNHGSGKAIISMSLGGPGSNTALQSAIDNAHNSGISVTVAAGNENSDACTKAPAYVPSAITVGASTQSDTLAGFSNYGSCVDINAPGTGICSTYPGASSACWDGTSMATPHVAGALAVLWSNEPALSVTQAEGKLLSSATSSISTSQPAHTSLLLNVYNFGPACDSAGCDSCPTGASVCEVCADGYVLNNNACEACTDTNCQSCTGTANNCVACDNLYSLVSGVCIMCPANCDTCSSSNTCTTCASGFFKNSAGACVQFCVSRATSTIDSIVAALDFAGISYSGSECSDYRSLAAQQATVTAGATYAMGLTQGTCNPNSDYTKSSGVWIDWNGDGTFDEATERVLTGDFIRPTYPVNVQVTVPANAFVGTVGGRAIVREDATVTACNEYQWGETVDFTVTVTSGQPQCTQNSDCPASDACQTASCSSGQCVESPISNCCLSTSDCQQDLDICTATNCVSNQCVNQPIAGCCKSYSDCPASTTNCFEATCVTNNCVETRICDCCEADGDCDDVDETTVDQCKLDGTVGQCYHTPVDCDNSLNGACWFLAAAQESCEAKCVAEGRQVSADTTSTAGSGGSDAECLAVAQLFDASAVFSRSSAHARGCVLTANGVVRGTRGTLDDAACAGEQRFCACDSVSPVTGQTLALVGGGIALLLGGLLGGMVIQKKRARKGTVAQEVDEAAVEIPVLEE